MRVFSEQVGHEVRKEALTGHRQHPLSRKPCPRCSHEASNIRLRGGITTRDRCRKMLCSRISPISASQHQGCCCSVHAANTHTHSSQEISHKAAGTHHHHGTSCNRQEWRNLLEVCTAYHTTRHAKKLRFSSKAVLLATYGTVWPLLLPCSKSNTFSSPSSPFRAKPLPFPGCTGGPSMAADSSLASHASTDLGCPESTFKSA